MLFQIPASSTVWPQCWELSLSHLAPQPDYDHLHPKWESWGQLSGRAQTWNQSRDNRYTINADPPQCIQWGSGTKPKNCDLKPKGQPLEEKCHSFDIRTESPPFGDRESEKKALTSESLCLLSRNFHLRVNPRQKKNQCHRFWMCPHVSPRVAVVTDHKANPSNVMWRGAEGFVHQPQSFIVPLCLPCQSHLTAIATETISFSLDLSPSCFTFPHHAPIDCPFCSAHQPCFQMGFISHVCLIWAFHYLNLSCLHLRVYYISHLATFLAIIHLPPANRQQYSQPSPLLVSLVKLTLHGCLVPHTCHWLPIFLERHNFSSCFIWDSYPLSTICLILFPSPHFPKDLIPMFMKMGFLYVSSTPWPLWSSPNHKVLISKANYAH